MTQLIHDKIKKPLGSEILFGELSDGSGVAVTVKDEELVLDF